MFRRIHILETNSKANNAFTHHTRHCSFGLFIQHDLKDAWVSGQWERDYIFADSRDRRGVMTMKGSGTNTV